MARPKIEFNKEDLEKLMMIGATDEEIAAWFEVSVRTVERKRKDPEYSDIFYYTPLRRKVSLRRSLYQAAAKGAYAPMIFLAKIDLGMKETNRTELSNPDGTLQPAPSITINFIDPPKPTT